MSRTYHHGLKAKKRKFGDRFYHSPRHHKPTPPKVRRTKHHWVWMTTPSWWIREMMNQPQRAKTRQLLVKVTKLKDIEDAPLFPLAKKPHVYYW